MKMNIKSKAIHDCGCITAKIEGSNDIHFITICELHMFGKYVWIAMQHDKIVEENKKKEMLLI